MPYKHTFNFRTGKYYRIYEDTNLNFQNLEHDSKKILPETIYFTIKAEVYVSLSEMTPEQRVELFKEEFPDVQQFKHIACYGVTKQNDDLIAWTDQDQLMNYLDTQLNFIQRIRLRRLENEVKPRD